MQSRRPCATALCLFGLFATTACGSNASKAPLAPSAVATLAVGGLDRYTLQPGLTIRLTATLILPDTTTQDCTTVAAWSSSNEMVVKATGAVPGEFRILGVGDANLNATCGQVTGRAPVRVDQPTSWPVSGLVISGGTRTPIVGATLTRDGVPWTTTDNEGRYAVVTGPSPVRVTVAAPGFVTREMTLQGGVFRTDVAIDLIPDNLLQYYRDMVRGAKDFPASTSVRPVVRWTEPPNFYIATEWGFPDLGKPVNPETLAKFIDLLPQMVSAWTGGRMSAGKIETGKDVVVFRPGTIVVRFQVTSVGNAGGYDGKLNGGFVQIGSDAPCGYLAWWHEVGHAMGLQHSSQRPSIMGGGYFLSCTPPGPTPEELAVAYMMYGRAPGNMDKDVDPVNAMPFFRGRR